VAEQYSWTVRKGNTARLAVFYQDSNGTAISTAGCIGMLYVYDGNVVVISKSADNIPTEGRFDLFLTVTEVGAFDFRQASYEFNVTFPGGDVTTLVDGSLIVESGRGPFE
jgi:hypothetical protein